MAARLSRAGLARVGLDVVSFSPGLDERGHVFLLKFLLKDGRAEVIMSPAAVACHLRDSIRGAARQHRYKDVRRRVGDTRPEARIIREFLQNQPELERADWNAMAEGRPHMALGCEVHSFSDAVCLAFQLKEDLYQVFRLRSAISFYLPEMINEAERTGRLINLAAAQSPSGRVQ